ncbi:MAG: hypothetical protein ABW168_20200, partial [Sedimenticola sp.]
MDPKRIKKLTPKAMEQYEDRVFEFKRRLGGIKDQINQIISSNESVSDGTSYSSLSDLTVSIQVQRDEYDQLFCEFMAFLTRTCTVESNIESVSQTAENKRFRGVIVDFVSRVVELKVRTLQIPPTSGSVQSRPHKSPSFGSQSSSSRASSSSKHSITSHSVLAGKHAKAEAARAQLVFIEKEAEIRRQQAELQERVKVAAAAGIRQQADLETELKLIQERKMLAAVTAEAEALEVSLGGSRQSGSLAHIPRSDPGVRTAEFVRGQEPDFRLSTAAPSFTPARVDPAMTPVIVDPAFTHGRVDPALTLVTVDPAFTPAMVDPAFTPARTDPAFTSARVDPAFTPARAGPAFTPTSVDPTLTA